MSENRQIVINFTIEDLLREGYSPYGDNTRLNRLIADRFVEEVFKDTELRKEVITEIRKKISAKNIADGIVGGIIEKALDNLFNKNQ